MGNSGSGGDGSNFGKDTGFGVISNSNGNQGGSPGNQGGIHSYHSGSSGNQ